MQTCQLGIGKIKEENKLKPTKNGSASKAPAKGAKAPTAGKKKSAPVAKCKQLQAAKAGQKSPKTSNPAKKSIFEGATEVSVTGNKIAITRKTSQSKHGKYSERTTRDYVDVTPESEKELQKLLGSKTVKKVTVALK